LLSLNSRDVICALPKGFRNKRSREKTLGRTLRELSGRFGLLGEWEGLGRLRPDKPTGGKSSEKGSAEQV